jgi:hypothetical protein
MLAVCHSQPLPIKCAATDFPQPVLKLAYDFFYHNFDNLSFPLWFLGFLLCLLACIYANVLIVTY